MFTLGLSSRSSARASSSAVCVAASELALLLLFDSERSARMTFPHGLRVSHILSQVFHNTDC